MELINTFCQAGRKNYECGNTMKVSPRKRKIEPYLGIESSAVALFSKDLGHISAINDGNGFWVMMSPKGPHKPQLA